MKDVSAYLEEAIRRFVVKEKQARFLELSRNPKRYYDFQWELLNDPRNIDLKFIQTVERGRASSGAIYRSLKDLGAGDEVFVISFNDDFDGRVVGLHAVLDWLVGSGTGTLISSLETAVGYYEGHEGWQYVLSKPEKSLN